MKQTLFLITILFAAACGSKSSGAAKPGSGSGTETGPDAEPAPVVMNCDTMAEQLGSTMVINGEFTSEQATQMVPMLVASCERTTWSMETMSCFAMASGGEATEDLCMPGMTEAQADDLEHAMD